MLLFPLNLRRWIFDLSGARPACHIRSSNTLLCQFGESFVTNHAVENKRYYWR
jgi:hypothetical protein